MFDYFRLIDHIASMVSYMAGNDRTHTHTYTHTHARAHTHTHIHTHTLVTHTHTRLGLVYVNLPKVFIKL